MNLSTVSGPRHWQNQPAAHLLAVLVAYVPVYAFALWTNLSESTLTLEQLILYPSVLGGGSVVLILLLHRYGLGEPLSTLQLRSGRWYLDILAGVLLLVLALGLMMLQNIVRSSLFPAKSEPLAEELITLFNGVARSPFLIALWLGPVAWIGVAAFEELAHVFALNHLWRVWPKPLMKWIVLIVSALLFGLVHIYQSPLNMLFITLQGLLYGLYFLRFGRVWPLIIAHALYDSLQVIQVVMVFHGL